MKQVFGIVIALSLLVGGFVFLVSISFGEFRRKECESYGEMTGREVRMDGFECYVRTGDHFVPRSEYGRQP